MFTIPSKLLLLNASCFFLFYCLGSVNRHFCATALCAFPLKTLCYCFSLYFAYVSFMYIINISEEDQMTEKKSFTSKDIKFGSIIKCVLYEICFCCFCTKDLDGKCFVSIQVLSHDQQMTWTFIMSSTASWMFVWQLIEQIQGF